MRPSLILSLVLHGAVLIVALFSFSASDRKEALTPVSVDVVTPSAISASKAGKQDADAEVAALQTPEPRKAEEDAETAAKLKPAEKLSKKQAALPPPKPKAPPPAPDPEPVQTAEAEPETASVPVPVKRAERPAPHREARRDEPRPPRQEKPRRQEERREPPRQERDRIAQLIDRPAPPAEGRRDFDANRRSALLNRDPTAGGADARPEPREPWREPSSLQEQARGATPQQERRVARGAPEGRSDRMSANEIDAFRAQISRCWTPPVGGLGGDAIIVKLRIGLSENGALIRPPEISNSVSSPFFRPAADSAVRAVVQCQPYQMPAEKYEQWRDMLLTFDPRDMYGG